MKIIALPLIISGALIASFFNPTDPGQKTKVLADNSRLTYNVNDKNKLDGAYFVENTQRNVWLRGSYKEGTRTGNWYAFNSDKTVFMRYNYDLKKLLYLDTVNLKKAQVSIVDRNEEAAKNASVPLPICSIDQYLSLLNESAKASFPKDQIIYNKPIDVSITANIKSAKDVTYTVTYRFNGFNYAFPINNKNMELSIDWIPATYNGKDVEAEFKVASTIAFNTNTSEAQRFKWNY